MYPYDVQTTSKWHRKTGGLDSLQWADEENEDSQDKDERIEKAEYLMSSYNEAMATFSEKTKVGEISCLTFQFKSTWEKATEDEKELCIGKAIDGCSSGREIIAQNAGDKLLSSCACALYQI